MTRPRRPTIECDFCARFRPWGGRLWRSLMPTLFYCDTCSPIARRYGACATIEAAERLRLVYRLAVNLRRFPHNPTKERTVTETTTYQIKLPIRGDGTALANTADSTFGLTDVKASAGTVMWCPDPDNEGNKTIFWVQGIQGPSVGKLPEGEVTLTLTYSGM